MNSQPNLSLSPFHLTFNFKDLRLTYHVNIGAFSHELQFYNQLDSHLLSYLFPSPIRRDFQKQHPSTQHLLWMPIVEESLGFLPPPPLLTGVKCSSKAPAIGLSPPTAFYSNLPVASPVGSRSVIDNVLQDTKWLSYTTCLSSKSTILIILPCRSSSLGLMKTRGVNLSGLGLAAILSQTAMC